MSHQIARRPPSHRVASGAARPFPVPGRLRLCVPQVPCHPTSQGRPHGRTGMAIDLFVAVTAPTLPVNGGARRSHGSWRRSPGALHAPGAQGQSWWGAASRCTQSPCRGRSNWRVGGGIQRAVSGNCGVRRHCSSDYKIGSSPHRFLFIETRRFPYV
jgi:hypothetical protein